MFCIHSHPQIHILLYCVTPWDVHFSLGLRYDNVLGKVVSHIDSCQARFALTLVQFFSHTDLITDLECFYTSILNLLDDTDEKDEVD